ncbi:hypothetical protein ACIBQ1_35590 [Nonomuraea sp. NPDC050153]|uniref:hypothetical protein n=1 Tax=Nonomuraea sp. NPDC050153 TaxID=3364359 RepID=UPI0037A1355E
MGQVQLDNGSGEDFLLGAKSAAALVRLRQDDAEAADPARLRGMPLDLLRAAVHGSGAGLGRAGQTAGFLAVERGS